MRHLLPILLFALGGLAHANPLEDARAAQAAAVVALDAVVGVQLQVRARHEALADRISQLKSRSRTVLPGVSDGSLDELLKQAHALSERLEGLDRQVSESAAEAQIARERLVSALDAALADAGTRLASGSAEARRIEFERMRSLVAERARLTAGATPSGEARVELPAVDDGASVDELRELADEASDNAERVRAQVAALESRLEALQARRRMLRAAVAFERDTSLFAEDERNRQLARAERPTVAVGPARRPTAVDGAEDEGAPTGGGGEVRGDQPGGAAEEPPPQAGAGNESPADPAFDADDAEGAEPDSDGDGLVDVPEIGPTGLPVQGADEGTVAGGGAVVFEASLDPSLLTDDVGALTPEAVAGQIRAVEARREALREAASRLEARRALLEQRARTLGSQ